LEKRSTRKFSIRVEKVRRTVAVTTAGDGDENVIDRPLAHSESQVASESGCNMNDRIGTCSLSIRIQVGCGG